MSHHGITPLDSRDFESPTSASSVIRAEGTHSRTSPHSNVDRAESCHNPCHTVGPVKHHAGDNIAPSSAPTRLGGREVFPARAIRHGWKFAHVDAPLYPEAA